MTDFVGVVDDEIKAIKLRLDRIEKYIDNQTVIWAKAVETFKSINNRMKLP